MDNVRLCWACGRRNAFNHDHHKRPRAAGGTDADIVNICSGCHDTLHRVADMLRSPKKAGMALDALKVSYPNNVRAQRNLTTLAEMVVEWMQAKADGAISPDDEIAVTLTLPIKVQQAMKLMANECRHTNGRRMGLATYLRGQVCAMVYERFPQLRPPAP